MTSKQLEISTKVDLQWKNLRNNIKERNGPALPTEKKYPISLDGESISIRKGWATNEWLKFKPINVNDYDLIAGNLIIWDDGQNIPFEYWRPNELVRFGWNHPGHCAPNFASFLNGGLKQIQNEIDEKIWEIEASENQPRIDFLKGCRLALEGVSAYKDRMIKAYEAAHNADTNLILRISKIGEGNVDNLPQALQDIWFLHHILQNCGTPSAIGRIDQLLSQYWKNDVESNNISEQEAQLWINSFLLKFSERTQCGINSRSKADTGFQNMVIGGIDEKGNRVDNEITLAILNFLKQYPIIEPKVTIRMSNDTEGAVFHHVSEAITVGGGQPAIYDEISTIAAMERHGFSHEISSKFATDGCWETTIPGESAFFWVPFDCLEPLIRIIQEAESYDYDTILRRYLDEIRTGAWASLESMHSKKLLDTVKGKSFDSLAQERLKKTVANVIKNGGVLPKDDVTLQMNYEPDPDLLMSIFTENCIEKARDVCDFGAKITIIALVARSVVNAIDGLIALKKAVFEERIIGLEKVSTALIDDFNNDEALRQWLIKRCPKFGSADDETDSLAKSICEALDQGASIARTRIRLKNTYFTVGVATYGWEVDMGKHLGASPDGRHSGSPIASNMSPMPGGYFNGVSSMMMSTSRLPKIFSAGAPLDISIEPSLIEGNEGCQRLGGLIATFLSRGGSILSVNVVDSKVLKRAMVRPLDYADLRVRVGGWQAYFVTLEKSVQENIIRRVESTEPM